MCAFFLNLNLLPVGILCVIEHTFGLRQGINEDDRIKGTGFIGLAVN